MDEHAHLTSHMTPGHALSAMEPPYFLGKDGLDFAALDFLTGFVKKVFVPLQLLVYIVTYFGVATIQY